MLLANRSGQDIEYRLGGGGANTVTWVLLRKGAELSLKPAHPCTLEVREARADGKPVLQKRLTKPHDLVEILLADKKYKAKATVKVKAPIEDKPKPKTPRNAPPDKGAELRG
jgi:hypothetical protein